jgi:transmembrane sensor
MKQGPNPEALDRAVEWRIRLRNNDGGDWEAFTDWLEEDPGHAAGYDAVALADDEFDGSLFPSLGTAHANDDAPVEIALVPNRLYSGWVAGGAAVAAVVVAAIGLSWQTTGSNRYQLATAPGERRMATMADGTSIVLNGGTRLVLDRRNSRFVELAAGEATFTVRPNPAQPFEVAVGDDRFRDIGTTFNLIHDPGRTAVEVIEGAVLYNPDGEAISLKAGQTLAALDKQDQVILGQKDPSLMAGWRQGQLSYTATPLANVAVDLSRTMGVPVEVAPDLATQPFTGSIRIAGGDAATIGRLSSALAVTAHRNGKGWRLEPRGRAAR